MTWNITTLSGFLAGVWVAVDYSWSPWLGANLDRAGPTLLSAAWKHRVLFVAILGAAIATGVVVSLFTPESRVWSAEALIIIRNPAATDGTGFTTERFITEQLDIMTSPIVSGAAEDALANSHPEFAVTREEIDTLLTVNGSSSSPVVDMSFTDPNPDRSTAIVNAVGEAFREVSRAREASFGEAALERIDLQLASLSQRSDEVAIELEQLRAAGGALTSLEAQAFEALDRIVVLQDQLAEASGDEANEIRAQISDYRRRIDVYQEAERTSLTNPDLQALVQLQNQLIDRQTELLQTRDRIAIDVETSPGGVGLFDPADEETEIVETGVARTLAVSIILGLFAAFAATYLRELPKARVFSTRHEPEPMLGAPLLADIPRFSEEQLTSRLPIRSDPRSAAAESFRFASRSIEDALRGEGYKSVMFVGSTSGHGKSTCLVNTALASARPGHDVLVIDCDFGNQDAARLLLGDGIPPSDGLVEVVMDDIPLAGAITTVDSNNVPLALLSRGSLPMIAADLLATAEAANTFVSVTDDFDTVFVDGPPMLQVAYSSTLANHVDALVVVVSHDTPVQELEELTSRLKLIDTPILGYLYNQSPLRREMRATDGSMVDILGQGISSAPAKPRPSWWQRVGS